MSKRYEEYLQRILDRMNTNTILCQREGEDGWWWCRSGDAEVPCYEYAADTLEKIGILLEETYEYFYLKE